MNIVPDITPCLLDIHNPLEIDGVSVSAMLRKVHREHLWDDRGGCAVDTIVIHYISACDEDARRPFDFGLILKIFCSKVVSCHYLIQRDGQVFLLVPEDKKAWHCGGSIMPEPDRRTGVNDFSVGIELVATHDSGFTRGQYASCAAMCADIEKRAGRKCTRLGHQDIAGVEALKRGLRSDIKVDPGPNFDWEQMDKMLA
jgi:N-acetyl-anhydromuramyl-L-alanine amidase AmpD